MMPLHHRALTNLTAEYAFIHLCSIVPIQENSAKVLIFHSHSSIRTYRLSLTALFVTEYGRNLTSCCAKDTKAHSHLLLCVLDKCFLTSLPEFSTDKVSHFSHSHHRTHPHLLFSVINGCTITFSSQSPTDALSSSPLLSHQRRHPHLLLSVINKRTLTSFTEFSSDE